MFKGEAKASNFQLPTLKMDFYEDIFQPQGFIRRCRQSKVRQELNAAA